MTFDVAIVFIAAGIVVGLLCLTALILYEGGFFGAGWVLKRSNVFFFAVDHRTIYQWKLASIRLIVYASEDPATANDVRYVQVHVGSQFNGNASRVTQTPNHG
jgi:hypothetical protein